MNIEDCFVFTPRPLDCAGEGDVCFTRSWTRAAERAVNIGPLDGEMPPGIKGVKVENPRAAMNEVIRQHLLLNGRKYPDSVISPYAIINGPVEMGRDCYVGSGTVIGEDGFAFDRVNGILKRFPHLGKVIIGDRVEIQANCCIARGSLKDTVIEDDVKIDNLVHVGHNCYIGKESMLTAGVILGGSTVIGKRVWIGLNATTRDGITIGDDAYIGMGACVVKDVPSGVCVVGNPAREMKGAKCTR